MTAAALPPLIPVMVQRPLALDVVFDAPTAREYADVKRKLGALLIGDALLFDGGRVDRAVNASDAEYYRLKWGGVTVGTWYVITAAALARIQREILARLMALGVKAVRVSPYDVELLCDDPAEDEGENPSENMLYDAFEAFIQEGLWLIPAETCSSSPGTSSCSETTRRYLARNMSSAIWIGWRQSWTLLVTSNSGAKYVASSPRLSTRSTSGVRSAGVCARNPTSHLKPIRGISSTIAAKSVRTSANGKPTHSRLGVRYARIDTVLKNRKSLSRSGFIFSHENSAILRKVLYNQVSDT